MDFLWGVIVDPQRQGPKFTNLWYVQPSFYKKIYFYQGIYPSQLTVQALDFYRSHVIEE